MDLSIRHIRKEFDGFAALEDVSLDIRSGELIALLGPSGSGKTTLLRLIAGLDHATSGSVYFGDQDASLRSVQERNVGFVFQHYALFRHMTVAENIGFGLKVRDRADRPSAADIRRKAEELLDLVQLSGLADRYPNQLSGGQRQRVALARALAIEPQILLLDEPFGALDAQVRRELRRWLREIHDRTGHTTVFVTHDQEEALELADRVAILNRGVIEQVGAPSAVYDTPSSAFVCGFVGAANRFEGEVAGGRFVSGAVALPAKDAADGRSVAFVRPHDFVPAESGVAVTVSRVVLQGPIAAMDGVTADGRAIEAAFAREAAAGFEPGSTVTLSPRKAHIYSQ